MEIIEITLKTMLKKPSLKLKNDIERFTHVRDVQEEEEVGVHEKNNQDFS